MIRRVVLIAATGLVVVVAAWFGLFWHPETSHLSALEDQRSQAMETVGQLEGQLAGLKALQLKTPAEKAALTKLEKAVPEGPSLDQLLDSLNTAAVHAGVTLTSVSAPTPAGWAGATTGETSAVTAGGPQSITLSVAVNGSNADVLRFVTALDSQPRLFVVDNFVLNGTVQTGGVQATTGGTSLSVQAFYVSAASGDPASLLVPTGAPG